AAMLSGSMETSASSSGQPDPREQWNRTPSTDRARRGLECLHCAPPVRGVIQARALSEANMGVIPLNDVSRRPVRMPVVTGAIIAVNVVVFVLELIGGDAFVTHWSLVPAEIVAGRHSINILT